MKTALILVMAGWVPLAAAAQDVAAAEPAVASDAVETVEEVEAVEAVKGTPDNPFVGAEVTLEDFLWVARPVVVFANTPADPSFQRQMELLRQRPEALAERDVVIITDTDPGTPSAVRRALRPRGFMLVIIGKDGQVELRKPAPWDVREISRTIDKTPLRQQEIRERGLTGR